MDVLKSIASSPLPATVFLLATATIVALSMIAARRKRSNSDFVEPHNAGRVLPASLSIPAAVAQIHSHLRDLAVDVEEVLPHQFRLIDHLILDTDREISRLQRRLAAARLGSTSVGRREPDIFLVEAAEPNQSTAPAVLRMERERLRRAA